VPVGAIVLTQASLVKSGFTWVQPTVTVPSSAMSSAWFGSVAALELVGS